MDEITEADEVLIRLEKVAALALARENLSEKRAQYRAGEETMGVVDMYQRALDALLEEW